jgi:hypothetical protein
MIQSVMTRDSSRLITIIIIIIIIIIMLSHDTVQAGAQAGATEALHIFIRLR